jgi:3-methyladenine DNA glycosylase AlkD
MTAQPIIDALNGYSNPERAIFYPKFFKAILGGYGEGDQFLGVTVPNQRIVAGRFAKKTTEEDLQQLIESPFHEVRLTALLILATKFKKASEKGFWADFYLRNIRYVNNWDLVDSSAHQILGEWLWDKERTLLYEMAKKGNLWEQRIAIMSTFCFIRRKDFQTTLGLAEMLITHRHDLIHKATGWMLREVGKRDFETERGFLEQHYRDMPRTMLRYAIEKFPPKEKAYFMQKA